MQIQQLDFVAERKRWEAQKARQAPQENDDIIEYMLDDVNAVRYVACILFWQPVGAKRLA